MIACLVISLESWPLKSALLPPWLVMPLRLFLPIILDLMWGKKNVVCASDMLQCQRNNWILGYTHICPEKVEDEPCIWEAWVPCLCSGVGADLTVVEALQLHQCKWNDEVVRWSDWHELACIDQHKSKHLKLSRMVEWVDITTLSELPYQSVNVTIPLFQPQTSLCPSAQVLRRPQHLPRPQIFAMLSLTATYLDFDILTCLHLMGKRYEMNWWILYIKKSRKIIFNWILFYLAMSPQSTTLIT